METPPMLSPAGMRGILLTASGKPAMPLTPKAATAPAILTSSHPALFCLLLSEAAPMAHERVTLSAAGPDHHRFDHRFAYRRSRRPIHDEVGAIPATQIVYWHEDLNRSKRSKCNRPPEIPLYKLALGIVIGDALQDDGCIARAIVNAEGRRKLQMPAPGSQADLRISGDVHTTVDGRRCRRRRFGERGGEPDQWVGAPLGIRLNSASAEVRGPLLALPPEAGFQLWRKASPKWLERQPKKHSRLAYWHSWRPPYPAT